MKTGSKCLNDYFDCDSKNNHWAEDNNKSLAGMRNNNIILNSLS